MQVGNNRVFHIPIKYVEHNLLRLEAGDDVTVDFAAYQVMHPLPRARVSGRGLSTIVCQGMDPPPAHAEVICVMLGFGLVWALYLSNVLPVYALGVAGVVVARWCVWYLTRHSIIDQLPMDADFLYLSVRPHNAT